MPEGDKDYGKPRAGWGVFRNLKVDGVGLPEKGACEERLGGARDLAMLLPREKH